MPTLDQIANGLIPPVDCNKALSGTLVAGRPYSFWPTAGGPGAGGYNGTLNGVVLDSTSAEVAGQIRFPSPGALSRYLARMTFTCTQAGMLTLADRLWHNGGITITSTSAQAITSPTWPARDRAGSTNGDGVLLAVEVSAATGAGTPTITISYTNQAGTAGRTATNIIATVATSAIGSTYLIGLQAGDTGVRSVQSITLSATWTSGTINIVAYRIIQRLPILAPGFPGDVDYLTGGGPRMYAGTVPYVMLHPNTTTSSQIIGSLVYSDV